MDIKTAHILGIHLVGSIAVTALLLAAAGCGGWADWSEEQAARVPILGEPVDEAAVRDAVATVLGESSMEPFSIWFSDEPVVNPLTGKKASGVALLCEGPEGIGVWVPQGTSCVFETSLVHELVHLYDKRVAGRSCKDLRDKPHPSDLFGECGEGGLVGMINRQLGKKHCPGWIKPVYTCAAGEDR